MFVGGSSELMGGRSWGSWVAGGRRPTSTPSLLEALGWGLCLLPPRAPGSAKAGGGRGKRSALSWERSPLGKEDWQAATFVTDWVPLVSGASRKGG